MPLAQPLQQHVGTQQEILGTPPEDLIGLVGGEPVAPDQVRCQGPGLGQTAAAGQFLQLRRLQDVVLPQGGEEVSGGGARHDGRSG
jgi:hypothetical protein